MDKLLVQPIEMVEKKCNECGNIYLKPKKPEGYISKKQHLHNQWCRNNDGFNIDIKYTSLKDQERLERLFRRMEHLQNRVEAHKQYGTDIAFDSMEISALKHALKEIARYRSLHG